jgi:hypothetical protein
MSYLENKDHLPDHRKPDKLDRIKAYLMDPENNPINSYLQKSLGNYKMVMTFMLENALEKSGGRMNSPGQAIAFLEKTLEYSYPQAAKIVRETLQLYGNFFQYDQESLKYLHYERLLRLSDSATANGDYKAARAIEKEAIELMDLKNTEKVDKKQILQFFQININRTTDPAALKGPIDITPEGEDG